MNKFFISIILLATNIWAAEVSVFGAGDLNSPNPYGLTKTEKHILKNKKELGSIDTKVKSVKTNVETINERIDGLESIYEGDSQKLNSSVIKLNTLLQDFDINQNQTNDNAKEIKEIKEVSKQILSLQEENFKNLKKAITKLTKTVNMINKRYISEQEFKKNMKQFITRAEFEALKKNLGVTSSKSLKANSKAKKDINKKLTGNDKKALLAEAKGLFKKDFFTKAIPIFESLIEQNYKPAESNFYLGEIWYYRKKYDKAIVYFKQSALLYDKASWMPKLLLHSAISFEKTGDLQNAANFYDTLVNLYPESKEAVIANKNLTNIE